MARKPADKVGLVLRFTEGLRRRIEKAARAHHRSMNAEIVERLEASFRAEDWDAGIEGMAEKLAEQVVINAMPKIAAKVAAEKDFASMKVRKGGKQ